jgi:hypothetical protein
MISQNNLRPHKNETFKKKEEEIFFVGAQNCCVSFVDVNSICLRNLESSAVDFSTLFFMF